MHSVPRLPHRGQVPRGDHVIILGEVVELGIPRLRREPLIFFEGTLGALEEDLRAGHPICDG